MKRILLFFYALLMGISGAWAVDFTVANPTQVTDLSTLSPNKLYILKSCGGNGYYNYYDGTQMSSKGEYDYSCVVRLINNGEGYAIQQMSTKTYYQALSDGTLVSLGTTPVYYTVTAQQAGVYFFDNSGYKLNTNNTGNLPKGANSTWAGAFSQWKIYEVDVYKDVTIVDGSNQPYDTYGTRNNNVSPNLFTSNETSGVSGVVVSAPVIDRANWWDKQCLAIMPNAPQSNEEVSFSIPEGYLIDNISMTLRANSTNYPYNVTINENTTRVTGAQDFPFSIDGINAKSFSFTINHEKDAFDDTYKWLAVTSMVIKLKPALTPLVNVTYQLYESDGTTLVSSVKVIQEVNSNVAIPATINNKTYYNYTTEGTIGTEDCTIKVIRTLKPDYVISLDGFSNSKCYNIRNNRGTWAVGSGATVVNSTVELNLAFLASDTKQQFAFITYEGNVYLYSVGEGKFAYVDGTKLSLTDAVTSAVAESPVTLQESTSSFKNSEPIIVKVGGKMFGVSTGFSPDVYQYTSQSDDGNCAYIIEAGSFDATAALAALEEHFHPSYFVTYVVKDTDNNILYTSEPIGTTLGAHITTLPSEYQRSAFYTYNETNVTISEVNTTVEFTATPKESPLVKYTADATNPIWYKMRLNTYYPTYNANNSPNVSTPATNADDETVQWAFIGEPYAGFHIICRAANNPNLVLGSAQTTDAENTGCNVHATFDAAGSQANELWYPKTSTHISNGFYIFNEEGHALNRRNESSLDYWTTGYDAGSTFVATEVLEGAALYDALIAQLEAIPFGTGLNQYRLTGSLAGFAGNEAALIAQLKSEGYSAENLAGAQDMLENSALNIPQANTFLRIRSINGEKAYLKAAAAGTRETFTTTKDEQTIFLWDADGKLISYHSGLANNNVREAGTIGGGASRYSILPAVSGNIGQYSLTAEYNNAVNYLYSTGVDGSNADRNTLAAQFYQNNSFTLEEVTTLPIAMNAFGKSYYSTFYSPVNVEVSGAKAYTLTLKSNYLSATEISNGVIPANTGVVLVGTSAAAKVAVTDETPSADSGVLTGTIATATSSQSDYIFTVVDNEIGFYKNGYETVKGFKAFYRPSDSSVRGFAINFGLNDAITDILHQVSPKNVYDLQGRRVNEPAKGLYIINGKKVIK